MATFAHEPAAMTALESALRDERGALIENNVEALLRLSDRHLILEKGRIVWSGTSRALAADPLTRDRYLSV